MKSMVRQCHPINQLTNITQTTLHFQLQRFTSGTQMLFAFLLPWTTTTKNCQRKTERIKINPISRSTVVATVVHQSLKNEKL